MTPQRSIHLAHRLLVPSALNVPTTVVNESRVRYIPKRSKVCIVGAGLYRDQAPLDDRTWVVWALNLCAPIDGDHRLRADLWWDMHQRCAQTADDLLWIAKCPVPIYVPDDLLDVPRRGVKYPLKEIEAVYGAYWSCTFAFQIALVLYENHLNRSVGLPEPWTHLGLYGVELAFGTERERTVEWACVTYWLGRAAESGIKICLPPGSSLLHHPPFGTETRYGVEYQTEIDAVNKYTTAMRHSRSAEDVDSVGIIGTIEGNGV